MNHDPSVMRSMSTGASLKDMEEGITEMEEIGDACFVKLVTRDCKTGRVLFSLLMAREAFYLSAKQFETVLPLLQQGGTLVMTSSSSRTKSLAEELLVD